MTAGKFTMNFDWTEQLVLQSTSFVHPELHPQHADHAVVARYGREKDFMWTGAVRGLAAFLLTSVVSPTHDPEEFVINGAAARALFENFKSSKIATSSWMTRMFGRDKGSRPMLARIIHARKPAGMHALALQLKHLAPSGIAVYCNKERLRDHRKLGVLLRCLALDPKNAPEIRELKQEFDSVKQEITLFEPTAPAHVSTTPVPNSSSTPTIVPVQADSSRLLEVVDKFLRDTPNANHYLDVHSHLSNLRKEIAILEDIGDPDGVTDLLKKQIKDCCIISEDYFTGAVASTMGKGRFLYACSSLIDCGYTQYVTDPGWLLLLRRMGQAARFTRGEFIRVFFIELRPLLDAELTALTQIITRHLQQGIHVGLIEDSAIAGDSRIKRNMALLGHRILLHATDQVQWDLDITPYRQDLKDADEKHSHFLRNLLYRFTPKDSGQVATILRELFPSLPFDITR